MLLSRLLLRSTNWALDMCAPMRTIQVHNNYAPWLSKEALSSMRARNIAQHRASVSNLDTDWEYYRTLRNQTNGLVKRDKSSWRVNKMKMLGSNSSMVWKNVKDWFGWNKQGPPTKLLYNGNIYMKPADLSRIMNESFISKINNHVSNLGPCQTCPVENIRNMMNSNRSHRQMDGIL